MSKIAIIDYLVDQGMLYGKKIEVIDLCGAGGLGAGLLSHGTLCAMALDHCASDYELVNIAIFKGSGGKMFTDIKLLAKALEACIDIGAEVVSLSAVSTILSDSRHIYGITKELSERAAIVGALDNGQCVTVPSSYPHVIGAQSDRAGLLPPGGLAYMAGEPSGAHVFANCSFDFLREHGRGPSNSFAAPVVAAWANGLINSGVQARDVLAHLGSLPPYTAAAEGEAVFMSPEDLARELPVVLLLGASIGDCAQIMDALYERHGYQSSALSLTDGGYDVRIMRVGSAEGIEEGLRLTGKRYKTDLIFVIAPESLAGGIRGAAPIDITATWRGGVAHLEYEGVRETVPIHGLPDRIVGLLQG